MRSRVDLPEPLGPIEGDAVTLVDREGDVAEERLSAEGFAKEIGR